MERLSKQLTIIRPMTPSLSDRHSSVTMSSKHASPSTYVRTGLGVYLASSVLAMADRSALHLGNHRKVTGRTSTLIRPWWTHIGLLQVPAETGRPPSLSELPLNNTSKRPVCPRGVPPRSASIPHTRATHLNLLLVTLTCPIPPPPCM